MINTRKLSEYRRVTFFLHAFSDKIGNKLCKRCNIDLDDPNITDRVFPELKREALDLCVTEVSQMQKLRRQIEFDIEDEAADVRKKEQKKKEQEKKEQEKKKKADNKKNNMDDLADMMKDLKIFQLEKQLSKLAKASQQVVKGQNPTALPFYPPN